MTSEQNTCSGCGHPCEDCYNEEECLNNRHEDLLLDIDSFYNSPIVPQKRKRVYNQLISCDRIFSGAPDISGSCDPVNTPFQTDPPDDDGFGGRIGRVTLNKSILLRLQCEFLTPYDPLETYTQFTRFRCMVVYDRQTNRPPGFIIPMTDILQEVNDHTTGVGTTECASQGNDSAGEQESSSHAD